MLYHFWDHLPIGSGPHCYLTFPGTAWLPVMAPGGVFCFGRCHGFRLRLNPLTAAMAAVTSVTLEVLSDPVYPLGWITGVGPSGTTKSGGAMTQ